jgi:hypothetical protein
MIVSKGVPCWLKIVAVNGNMTGYLTAYTTATKCCGDRWHVHLVQEGIETIVPSL